MTLRIEKTSADGRIMVRLIGRVQSEDLAEIKTQLEGPKTQVALDLEEVTLVDVGVVRFLAGCEARGIDLLQCSGYIRRWMTIERQRQCQP
jgi:hypothetical protein